MSVLEHKEEVWEEILASRPALSPDVRIYPHSYRGVDWYLLFNLLTNDQLLIDDTGYWLLQEFETGSTVIESLTRLQEDRGIALERDDVAPLFVRLREAGMLAGDMQTRAVEMADLPLPQKVRRLISPFAIKIPLLDPERLLQRLSPVSGMLFSQWGAALVAALVVVGAIVSVENWPMLQQHWASRFYDPVNMLWLVILYPLVKILHELSHGLAARHWGAEIHEMGIMFLVFFPVPYVDASSTAAFHAARHRMTVAAAGILTEASLASIAVLAWTQVSDGFVRDMLFNTAVIGGVSTVLFNGNPLLRFDGYYVLSDALEIPNLGPRSSAYLGYLFRTYVLGLDSFRPHTTGNEAVWLVLYGIASGVYRLFIGFTIALYVAGRFFIIGLALAFWFLIFQILRPVARSILRVFPQARADGKLPRFVAVMVLLFIVAPWLIFVVPLPQSTVAPGIVLPPETSHLRVATSGFVDKVLKSNGEVVYVNEIVFELEDAELGFEEQRLLAQLDEFEAQFRSSLAVDHLESQRLKAVIESVDVELHEAREDIANLAIRSRTIGSFSGLLGDDVVGRYFNKGDVLGYVTSSDDWTARVMVSQEAIDLVRYDTRGIHAVFASDPFVRINATLESETPLASQFLPARSLGTQGGGLLPVDARDPDGRRLVTPMFEVTVRLPDEDYLVGQTVLVRFLHGSESAGRRLSRWLTRLLSKRLGLDSSAFSLTP